MICGATGKSYRKSLATPEMFTAGYNRPDERLVIGAKEELGMAVQRKRVMAATLWNLGRE